VVFSHTPFILVNITSRAALCPADDVRVRRGDNHIRHSRDADVQAVCRNGRGIPGTGTDLFVNDDGSTTQQINRLIRLTRYRD
jgi:hypothetical protein